MSGMKIKDLIFEEEKEEFPWDENALKTFKNLIREQRITCLMDDVFLLGFLRATEFDLPSSLQLLKNYYNTRVNYPQYIKNLLPSKMEDVVNMNIFQYLPKPDQDGSYICFFRCANWDTSVANGIDVIRVILLIWDLQLNLHRTQENKIICIVDAEGFSLSHFYNFSPRVMSAFATLALTDSYPLRFREIHYVNMNVIFEAILTVFIPLLPDKIKKTIHLHSDITTLTDFISPDCLPSQLGGNLPPFDPNEANKMLKANEEFLRRNEEYVKLYEKSIKNCNEDTSLCKDVNRKEFIEKAEEIFERHSNNPEDFLACMKENFEFDIDKF
ncbi:alpha-tocopherol transfer protein-like isoform X2 [Centruroides sculpturatus]|uniref:alpha-tocopherol transfer protein-like isoform X2 n=1 Tax=Centruroides sculpturatus TaxID=218467 RepID=UPI000C6DD536|nr:alpha-tocopherol transfer protein-like isoform X2 [Centruroides sculpturatus]